MVLSRYISYFSVVVSLDGESEDEGSETVELMLALPFTISLTASKVALIVLLFSN